MIYLAFIGTFLFGGIVGWYFGLKIGFREFHKIWKKCMDSSRCEPICISKELTAFAMGQTIAQKDVYAKSTYTLTEANGMKIVIKGRKDSDKKEMENHFSYYFNEEYEIIDEKNQP